MVKKTGIALSILALLYILIRFTTFLQLSEWLERATLNYEIVPVDVIDLVVTSAVTIGVGYFIVKRLSEQRFEKEMLIEDLRRIEEKVSSIEHAFDSNTKLDLSLVSGELSTVRHLIDRFKHTLQMTGNPYVSDIEQIDRAFNQLFRTATDFKSMTIEPKDVDKFAIISCASDVILKLREVIVRINNH